MKPLFYTLLLLLTFISCSKDKPEIPDPYAQDKQNILGKWQYVGSEPLYIEINDNRGLEQAINKLKNYYETLKSFDFTDSKNLVKEYDNKTIEHTCKFESDSLNISMELIPWGYDKFDYSFKSDSLFIDEPISIDYSAIIEPFGIIELSVKTTLRQKFIR